MAQDITKRFMKRDLKKEEFTHKEAERACRFWVVVHTDEGGYVELDYTIHSWENGDFTISDNDGDGFVSLHGEIAKNILSYLAQES